MTRFAPLLTAQIAAVGRRLAALLARPTAVCGAGIGRCAVAVREAAS